MTSTIHDPQPQNDNTTAILADFSLLKPQNQYRYILLGDSTYGKQLKEKLPLKNTVRTLAIISYYI